MNRVFGAVYSILNYDKKYLSQSVQKYNLKVIVENDLVIQLQNEYCRVSFTNADNNAVQFKFYDVRK